MSKVKKEKFPKNIFVGREESVDKDFLMVYENLDHLPFVNEKGEVAIYELVEVKKVENQTFFVVGEGDKMIKRQTSYTGSTGNTTEEQENTLESSVPTGRVMQNKEFKKGKFEFLGLLNPSKDQTKQSFSVGVTEELLQKLSSLKPGDRIGVSPNKKDPSKITLWGIVQE